MSKVQCPNCKKVCHKTNESFDPCVRPNGGMVDLLQPWLGYGWGKFGEDSYGGSGVMAADMLCPLCQGALAPSGRLVLVPDDHQEVPKPKSLERLNQEQIDTIFIEEDDASISALIQDDQFPFVTIPFPTIVVDGCVCEQCGWKGKTESALKRHKTMVHHA